MKLECQYVILSEECVVRNEKKCSYLARINRAANKAKMSFDTLPIPPFMGYIFANIGLYPIPECYDKVARGLGVRPDAVKKFITQLLECNESQKFEINDNYSIVLPGGLVGISNLPESRTFKTVPDFSANDEFICKRSDIPFSVNLMTTTACCTDCIYCYADRSIKEILSTDEILSLLDDLHNEGVVNVTLTGGDLMMRSDWPILMKKIINYGYNHFISTKTPLKEAEIKYLVNLGFKEIQFSLDTIDPVISEKMVRGGVDYLCNVERMFNLCSKNDINVQVRTVVTKLNGSEEYMKGLYEFLSKHKCVKSWDITPAFFSGYKKEIYKDIAPDNEDLKWAFNFSRNRNLKFPVSTSKINENGYKLKICSTTGDFVCRNQICLANVTAISILANGKCTICEMIYQDPAYILGDVKNNTIRDIWNSEKALNFYNPDQEKFPADSPCRNCKDFGECRKEYGKRVCYSDICKTGLRVFDPDPRCPLSRDMDYIL